ncbi:MAG: cyclic nucleotide-binding domain-containing protein [Bacteroidota bacterium]
MTDYSFLKEIFKPENFSEDELTLVLSQFKRVVFNKNDFLMRIGKVANYYFFLEGGFVRSYAIDLEGNDITSKFYSKHDIVIDWHSYFLKTPAREDIQALTSCICWKINFADFMKLFSIEAFREVGRTKLVNDYFGLKNHTVSMVTEQAKDRYKQLMNDKPDIALNVPLKHIATYLGITDTSLSRIRKEITQEKD